MGLQEFDGEVGPPQFALVRNELVNGIVAIATDFHGGLQHFLGVAIAEPRAAVAGPWNEVMPAASTFEVPATQGADEGFHTIQYPHASFLAARQAVQ